MSSEIENETGLAADSNNIMSIEERHKKEERSLRAEIQKLKKSVPKGDRKQKKRVDALILQKLKEQREKHEEERLEKIGGSVATTASENAQAKLNIAENSNTKTIIAVDHPQTIKLGRAERRRLKKEKEDKELQEQIESEVANKIDYKQIEMDALAPILAQKRMKVHAIPADGNCLFNAIIHQLKLVDYQKVHTCQSLRNIAVECIQEKKSEYSPFILEDFDEYCMKMKDTAAWGGQLEIQCLSDALGIKITIYQANSVPMEIGDYSKNINIAYFRKAYGLGEHYDSLV